MVTGDRRLFSTRSFTTCLAFAKAASVASLLPNIRPKADIALRAVFPHLGGAVLGGFLQIDDGRQRLVVHLHELGGVARLGERLGHHEGDAVADETHLVGIEHGLERAVPLGRAEILRHQVGGEAAELLRDRIGAGETHSTPGAALALATSMRVMRAWACGESTVTPWHCPGKLMSST